MPIANWLSRSTNLLSRVRNRSSVLLGRSKSVSVVASDSYVPFGKARIKRIRGDLTIRAGSVLAFRQPLTFIRALNDFRLQGIGSKKVKSYDHYEVRIAPARISSAVKLAPLSKRRVDGVNLPERYSQKKEFPLNEDKSGLRGLSSSFKQRKPEGRTVQRTTRRSSKVNWSLLLPILLRPIDLRKEDWLDLPNDLYPFQVEGVYKLSQSDSFLLADEMGTGKTVMTCVALSILIQKGWVQRAVIICPKSLLGVWGTHLTDWANSVAVIVVQGTADDRSILWRSDAHVFVTTYDQFARDYKSGSNLAKKYQFDAMILDEAHAIKNPKTKRSKVICKSKSLFRWGLTGTPVQNDVKELLALFGFLRPDLFSRWTKSKSVPSPRQAHILMKPFFLRRRKADVFPDLPPKIRSDEWLELDSHQRAEYDAAMTEFSEQHSTFSRIHILALITKLKQICNFGTGRKTSPKAEAVVEKVRDITASGGKVLVFTQFLQYGVTILEELLEPFGVVTITGAISSHTERQRRVQQFQSDPQTSVFLATTKTGGEGLTLTAASYVIHFDHWWNPAVQWQAEDRAHRKGQPETVNVYNYWMLDTYEERIRALLEKKGLLHEQYVNSLSQKEIGRAITMEDLCNALEIDVRKMTRSKSSR